MFPASYDRSYHGHRLALWLLGALACIKIVMGFNCMFNGAFVASTADGFPLAEYTPAGSRAFLAMFAVWGLSLVVLGLLALLALLRYRSMVPLVFALLLLEQVGRKLIFMWMPVERTSGSGSGTVNVVLLVALLAGLALSLWRRPGSAC
jgi:hypothetical protein